MEEFLQLDKTKTISGALKQQIAVHGPITKENIGSATKRINGAINSLIKMTMRNKQVKSSGEQLSLFPSFLSKKKK